MAPGGWPVNSQRASAHATAAAAHERWRGGCCVHEMDAGRLTRRYPRADVRSAAQNQPVRRVQRRRAVTGEKGPKKRVHITPLGQANARARAREQTLPRCRVALTDTRFTKLLRIACEHMRSGDRTRTRRCRTEQKGWQRIGSSDWCCGGAEGHEMTAMTRADIHPSRYTT